MSRLNKFNTEIRLNYDNLPAFQKNNGFEKLGDELSTVIEVRFNVSVYSFQIIPKGVLIVFPNYEMMDFCYQVW